MSIPSDPTPHHDWSTWTRDGGSPAPSPSATKPIIVWDAVVSAVLFVVLIVELFQMVTGVSPEGFNWLANPFTYISLAIAIAAAVLTGLRIKRRRISFWVMLIFAVVVPLLTFGVTILLMIAAFGL